MKMKINFAYDRKSDKKLDKKSNIKLSVENQNHKKETISVREENTKSIKDFWYPCYLWIFKYQS